MMGLGVVYSIKKGSIDFIFVKSKRSTHFDCENSGYSHVSALSAIIINQIDPDILINFRYILKF